VVALQWADAVREHSTKQTRVHRCENIKRAPARHGCTVQTCGLAQPGKSDRGQQPSGNYINSWKAYSTNNGEMKGRNNACTHPPHMLNCLIVHRAACWNHPSTEERACSVVVYDSRPPAARRRPPVSDAVRTETGCPWSRRPVPTTRV